MGIRPRDEFYFADCGIFEDLHPISCEIRRRVEQSLSVISVVGTLAVCGV